MTPRHEPLPPSPECHPSGFLGGDFHPHFPCGAQDISAEPCYSLGKDAGTRRRCSSGWVQQEQPPPPRKKNTLGRKPPARRCLWGDPPPVQGSECPPPPFGAEGGGGGRDRSRQLANPAPAPSGSLLGQEPGSEPRTSSSPLNWIRFLAAGSGCRKPCPGAGEEGPHSGEEETHEISWFHSPQQAAGAFSIRRLFPSRSLLWFFTGKAKK